MASHNPTPGDPRSSRRQQQAVHVPGIDEILQKLIALNGAVAIGAMSATQAHLIQRNLKTVLDVQLKRAGREQTVHNQEALIDICRRDPKTLNVLAPFLTDEQLDALMAEIAGQTLDGNPDTSTKDNTTTETNTDDRDGKV